MAVDEMNWEAKKTGTHILIKHSNRQRYPDQLVEGMSSNSGSHILRIYF